MPSFSFYQNVVPLNSKVHQALRCKAPTDYRFARKAQSVAIGAGEFFDCAVEFPIVFVPTPQGHIPVALLGARPDENLFVDDEGKWDSGYLPAFVRRYPFVTLNELDQRLSVGFDADYKGIQEKGSEGERILNDDGQPTEFFQGVMKFLDRTHADFLRGEALGKMLAEKNLLQVMSAQMSIEGGAKLELSGFEVVDIAKLDAMSIGEQGLMAKTGDLALIHAHLVSMRNFRKLLGRIEKKLPAGKPSQKTAAPGL
jgi:hypothetical protein